MASVDSISKYIINDVVEKQLKAGDKLPTEHELARKLGVSRGIVNRAITKLQDSGMVVRYKSRGTFLSEDFDQAAGNSLKCKTSDYLYVLTDASYPDSLHWSANIFPELERQLVPNGKRLIFKDIPRNKNDFALLVEEIVNTGAIGIIIVPADTPFMLENQDMLDRFQGGVYSLSLGHYTPELFLGNVVCIDPLSEGIMAGEFLVNKGYKNITILIDERKDFADKFWYKERIKGLMHGIQRASKGTVEPSKITETFEDGKIYKTVCKEIRRNDHTVFVTLTDQTATELIMYAETQGLSVQNDFSIISFDDNPKYRNFNLTTVAPPRDKIGLLLGEIVVSDKSKHGVNFRQVLKIQSEIIERITC